MKILRNFIKTVALLDFTCLFVKNQRVDGFEALDHDQVEGMEKREYDAFLTGSPIMEVIWESHQNFRARADLPRISYDNGLAKQADMEASVIRLQNKISCNQNYKHSDAVKISTPAKKQGLNSAELHGAKISDFSIQEVQEAIEHWYETKKTYEFPGGNEPFQTCSNVSNEKDYGLFTQIMWANSTRMGCGSSPFLDCDKSIMVCLYEPQGNIKDHALMTDENFALLQASNEGIETCKRSETMSSSSCLTTCTQIKTFTVLAFFVGY